MWNFKQYLKKNPCHLDSMFSALWGYSLRGAFLLNMESEHRK